MATPKAVKNQDKQADKLHAALYPKEAVTEKVTPIGLEKEATPPAAEATPAVTEPVTEIPAAKPPEAAAPATEKPAGPEEWKHKYDVINGKYRAEVPRLHDQIKQLTTDLDTMRGVIDGMKLAAPTPQGQLAAAPTTHGVSDAEREEYGTDLLEVIGKASREQLSPDVEALKEQIKNLQGNLDGLNEKNTQSDKDRLLSDLTRAVPTWEEQNSDPLFLDWLSQQDPYSGLLRHQLLDAAFEESNTARVIQFFTGYLAENGVTQQPATETPARTAKVDLAQAAAPGKNRGATPAPKGNKRIWSQPDITRFYRDVQRGAYKGKEAELRALEKDLVAAQHEGRLVA